MQRSMWHLSFDQTDLFKKKKTFLFSHWTLAQHIHCIENIKSDMHKTHTNIWCCCVKTHLMWQSSVVI